jgi:Flp pilus assembly protein TadG
MMVLTRFFAMLRDRAANAAVEFAILTPILLLLVTGTVDLGLGFQEKLRLQAALNSGMQHAMQTAGTEIATTRKAIEHGLPAGAPVTVGVEAFCRCSATTGQCKIACAPGAHRFAAGSVSMPYQTLFFAFNMTLAANFEVYVGVVQ